MDFIFPNGITHFLFDRFMSYGVVLTITTNILIKPCIHLVQYFAYRPIQTIMSSFLLFRIFKILLKYASDNPQTNNIFLYPFVSYNTYDGDKQIISIGHKIIGLVLCCNEFLNKYPIYVYSKTKFLAVYFQILELCCILFVGVSQDINKCINYIFNTVVLPCVFQSNTSPLLSMFLGKPNVTTTQLPKSNFSGVDIDNNPLLYDSDSEDECMKATVDVE